jgi:hypothetical protein
MALCMIACVRQLAAPRPMRSAARLHRVTAPPAIGASAPTAEAMSPGPICAAAGIAAATDTAKTAAAAAKAERRRGMPAMTWIMVLPFSKSPALFGKLGAFGHAIPQPTRHRAAHRGSAVPGRNGGGPTTRAEAVHTGMPAVLSFMARPVEDTGRGMGTPLSVAGRSTPRLSCPHGEVRCRPRSPRAGRGPPTSRPKPPSQTAAKGRCRLRHAEGHARRGQAAATTTSEGRRAAHPDRR